MEAGPQRYQIYVNDQARTAADFRDLVVAYRGGAAVRLSDVGKIYDGVEDVRNLGMANGKPAILVILFRQWPEVLIAARAMKADVHSPA